MSIKLAIIILFGFSLPMSTGNVFPGTGENNAGIGATAWTTPENIVSDNTTDATCNAGASSQYLVARNFGFSIPFNAKIVAILVRIEASEHTSGTEALLSQLQNESGTLFGSSKSTSNEGNLNGTGKAVYTYGNTTTDLWGLSSSSIPVTIDYTIVNDADFGVRFWFTTAHNVAVDYVTMSITYSNGTAFFSQTKKSKGYESNIR